MVLRKPDARSLQRLSHTTSQGYVVASIQYRTIPDGAVYSGAVTDVKSAIRYLVQGAGHGDLSVPGVTTQAAKAWSTQVAMGKIVAFLNQNRVS